jgi:DNA-binding phage protein
MAATVVLNRQAVLDAMQDRRWNHSDTARALNITRSTLYRLIDGTGHPSPTVIGAMCTQLGYRTEAPELAFARLFHITPTEESE